MINYKPCKKHVYKTRKTNKPQGSRFMVSKCSQARCKAPWQYINNNNVLHVHVISIYYFIFIYFYFGVCSLILFRGFQNYGVVREFDVMLQGQPNVSKSHNYGVLTCPIENSLQIMYPQKFTKHPPKHLKKFHGSHRSSTY